MRPHTGLPYRYARALMACLSSQDKKIWDDNLDTISYTLQQLTNSYAFLHSRPQKRKEILNFFDIPYFKSFMRVILEYNRLEYLKNILSAFRKIYYEELKIKRVRIITAQNAPKERIKDKLGLKKNFKIDWVVNKNIIGGLILETDHKSIDGSILTKIRKLQNQLMETI